VSSLRVEHLPNLPNCSGRNALIILFQVYEERDPHFRHQSLPPHVADDVDCGGRPSAHGEEEEDIYESIYDSRWRLMQKVSRRVDESLPKLC